MKECEAEVVIENGGGNQQEIFNFVEELFDLRDDVSTRHDIWDKLKEIDCDRFYMENGAKVTRPIKGILTEAFGKDTVKILFPEFCKRVGNLYAQVHGTAHLRNRYFTDPDLAGSFGDSNSCFLPGGCNDHNGKFIDASPSTGVITISPIDQRYAPGRTIVWFKDSTTAHLINRYSADGQRELPMSIYARALEQLTGTKISWVRRSNPTLPVYLNSPPMICSAIEDTNFDEIVGDYRFRCTECGKFYDPPGHSRTSGTEHYIGCSYSCLDMQAEEEDDEDCVDCYHCGNRVHMDDSFCNNDEYYCERCYDRLFFCCEDCSNTCDNDDACMVFDHRGHERTACTSCRDENYVACDQCDEYHHCDNVTLTEEGDHYCRECAETHTWTCDDCGNVFSDEHSLDDDMHCEDCHVEKEEAAV